MENTEKYNINLDTKFKHLELIDVPSVVAACTEKWQNFTLTEVNDSVVRIGVVEGEFHWHKHDNDDDTREDDERRMMALNTRTTRITSMNMLIMTKVRIFYVQI